jgi:hypothetical protein
MAANKSGDDGPEVRSNLIEDLDEYVHIDTNDEYVHREHHGCRFCP